MYSRHRRRLSKPHGRVSQSPNRTRTRNHTRRNASNRNRNAHLALHFRWRGFPILLLGGCLCRRGGLTPGRSSNDEGGVGAFTGDATVPTTGGGGGGRHARRRSKSRRHRRCVAVWRRPTRGVVTIWGLDRAQGFCTFWIYDCVVVHVYVTWVCKRSLYSI